MKLHEISSAIRDDLRDYCTAIDRNRNHLNPDTRILSDQLVRQLRADTDYLQAHLVVLGYEICGGASMAAIIPVARSIQVAHAGAQLLAKGHGVASAHALHIAMTQLANVDAPDSLRIKALSITHRSMMLHAQGLAAANQTSANSVYCFATERILNPIHVGMVFTGVGCPETDAITPFAMAWGRAAVDDTENGFGAALKFLDELDFWPQQTLQNLRSFYLAQQ